MTLETFTLDVCIDCYTAHHYGYRFVDDADREATSQERYDYLQSGVITEPPTGKFIEDPHFGLIVRGLWYAGESDEPCDVEPLSRCEGLDLTSGDDDPHFVYTSCDGCGSHLGGDRHQLYYTEEMPDG